MRIQLLADDRYRDSFASYLSSQAAIELVSESPDAVFDAAFLDAGRKIEQLTSLASSTRILTNTLTLSATRVRSALSDGSQVIGLPIFPNYFDRQKTVEISLPMGASYTAEVAMNFLSALGKTGEQIGDTVAGVFPRTLAMIVNEAAFAVQESVAAAQDIDVAMKLGTNYPKGPLAWCDEIGAETIVAILDALARELAPERYRVAPLLRRHAEAGMKFLD
ncbi:MAG: 3-hydroxyacyl-CoA dehydrogenase family protein [Bacteroidota bacterium]|nr:3-hydroxyacyl-CoA dehydrogenase family protein [Bacteroidota bacterium]MDP4233050.1 3-hydroxyacyl-CoA dehydrogenase family protein [Bacteroidota bacterium]MDP4241805.1 3-hydroxyacyl-CoA dehydrogenase family protein [Bacteroidota bacterium]MDP4288774.1 3-hydroxyacyl-CoA dehydrogenase family protein [Bacteroidota bacterium]